ncbi:hypothetical protein NO263_03975 [Gluconacetobacter entanii]|uniref:Glycine-rich domain-containing protein n=1 Tax=Gluconacetobacter entanii TaxID=108528 RepID=A0ABT3K2W9_9PROT|nr:hypothetical protein [Gluconacetobacter entanii]MCE2580798.1 hypothetical protein [Komagataeibacter sp. FNDCR1]MCW4589735.1 hypothetical protein [Gluconacetobacter entanii]MCW4593438.1 hypothetical protein [Gluconacetobacter entanii]
MSETTSSTATATATESLPPTGFTAITETSEFEDGIYQIATSDPVIGGPGGIANYQAQGLANRTRFLMDTTTALQQSLASLSSSSAAAITAEAKARAAADAKLQPLLNYTPVQQGGGVYQAATKVMLGQDTTFSGLRYSYIDKTTGALTDGGYLISSYGTILSGSTQIGDITINSNGRMAFQSCAMKDIYTESANLSDVTAVSNSLDAYIQGGVTSGTNTQIDTFYMNGNGRPTVAYDGGAVQVPVLTDIATPIPFASSGTYTVAEGVTRIFFEAVGAGGPGAFSYGDSASNSIFAAGGGAGAYARGWLAVSSGDVVTVSIGAGGVCPANTINATVYGGATTISINGTVVLTCTGGQSGVWTSSNNSAGGSPGTVTSGPGCTVQLQANGGFGGDGQSGTTLSKGNGAAGPWGGGGRAGEGGGTGGNAPGAGGGGAYNTSGTLNAYYGGSGGPGYAILTTAP